MTTQLAAVVLDWAGTIVDFGSRAPVLAFVQVLAEHGIAVSEADVRVPMGLHKRAHLEAILAMPHVAAQMQGRADGLVDALYEAFTATQLQVIDQTSQLIEGFAEAAALLRQRGMRITATTGYTGPMSERVQAHARAQGFVADATVTVSDVPEGRPAPWMLLRCLEHVQVWPPRRVVKLGDTPADMQEGRAAGCWCVGLAGTGNEVGLSADAFAALPVADKSARLQRARERLLASGAHLVIDDWSGLASALDELERRSASGHVP